MNKTEHFKLKKPEGEDFYNIEDSNENMDLIDSALKALTDGKLEVKGTAENAKKVNDHTVDMDVPADAKFTDTTYSNFVKSGSGAKAGLVPAPSSIAGVTKYLREDGSWSVPPDNDTTYSNMTAATASVSGKSGLVPAPAAGAQDKYLRGDGTWQKPTNTTYNVATISADGLMSTEDKRKTFNSTKSQVLASYMPRNTSSYDVVIAGRCMTKAMYESCNADITCNTTVTVQLNDAPHNDSHSLTLEIDYSNNQFLRKLHSDKPTNASSSVISSARLVVDDGEMMAGYVFELLVLTITPKEANHNDYLNVYIDNANAIEPSSTVTPAFASLYSFEGNPPMGSWTTVYDENVDLSTDYSDQWTIEAAATI